MLEGLIPVKQDPNSGREEIAVLSPEHLGRLYVFAIMWSLGALLELDDREKMQEFMVDRCAVDLPPFGSHPPGTTIFEFLVDDKGRDNKLIAITIGTLIVFYLQEIQVL